LLFVAVSAQAEFRWRYGTVKSASATDYATVAAKASGRWWVRLRMTGDTGMVTLWQGQFASAPRDVFGSTDGTPRGHQHLVAYGANHVLDRMGIYQSYWLESGSKVGPLDWLPHINLRGKGGFLEGNRSASESGGSYLYGGTDIWTARQHIEYLLTCFVNDTGRPVFTLGGQTDILDAYTPQMPLKVSETARSILGKLIAPEFGMGYVPVPTADGWELRVFSHLPSASSFADATLPENTLDAVRIDAADDADIIPGGLKVEIDSTHLHDSIRVLGERAVVVCSGYYGTEIEEMWTSAEATAYKAMTDAARSLDSERHVFQALRFKDTWDWQDGEAAPLMNLDGECNGGGGYRQTSVRETLAKLPLYEGWDYSGGVAPTAAQAAALDFRPPLVLCRIDGASDIYYVPVDNLSAVAQEVGISLSPMSVRALEGEWGVVVEASPNHALAKDHWSGAAASAFDPDTDGTDYTDLIVTLALRTDGCLAMGYDLPEASRAGDGSVKVIECPGAEFWCMAPQTVVDGGTNAVARYDAGSLAVLRNDKDRLALVAAGAIARYLNNRAKASVTYGTLKPLGSIVGAILTFVDSGDVDYIGTPITSVEWNFEAEDGTGTTRLMTGHARR